MTCHAPGNGAGEFRFLSIAEKFSVPRPVTYEAQNQPTSKMKGYKRANGIPSGAGRKSRAVAARVRTQYDVLKAPNSYSVQPWIEKTKRGSVLRNEEVIKHRDYAPHCLDMGRQLGA